MSVIPQIWRNLQTLIPDLNSSAASIVKRIVDVTGSYIDTVRLEILRSEQVIEQAVRSGRVTTIGYHINRAFYYQEGSNLVVINQATGELGYATIDESRNIIKQATIRVIANGEFIINVCTSNAQRNLVRLNPSQLAAFRDYYSNFITAGAIVQVASEEPDVLSATNLYVRYDKNYELNNIKADLYTKIHDIQLARRTSSMLYINEVEASLIEVDGILDAYLDTPTLSHYGTVTTPTDGSVLMESGYFNVDPAIYEWDTNKTIFEAI